METVAKHIFSVSELNALTRQLLENTFGCIWVSGEISNLTQASSGHSYFSLKDDKSQVRCALFKTNSKRLTFSLKNGLMVTTLAQISLYETRGEFQLIVQELEPSGDGLLQKRFEALKQLLQSEGLFSTAHKKPLPALPQAIGVITSSKGAAIHDILTVLKRRFPIIPVIIYPTLVQGDQAARKIVGAIQIANLRQECDVLILARGGGSLEDLWPFNEEIVARAIFASQIPIITGVGHEIDFTIADFVADERAPTPSAAAERISPDSQEWLQKLGHLQKRLDHILAAQLRHQHSHLLHISKRLRHPGQRLHDQSQNIDLLEHRLQLAWRHYFQHRRNALNQVAQSLNTLSPLNTLERGYSIVRATETQNIIASTDQLHIGATLSVQFAKGACECKVEKVNS
ncbi:MAG: exodeoxyribonuclease VII large subunit [Proteobacteria bacterium]|nr:exodeoxyribonuclease VII large subunit [Pseudomonadota bacterium]